MNSIILTGGGTAGHIIPNIALLPYLKKHFDKIYYIGSTSQQEKSLIEKENIPFYSINSVKFRRDKLFKNVSIPFKLGACVDEAKQILQRLKPNVIFSKGGYVSLPTVIAGKNLGIPVICHESDYSLGLANKVSIPFCNKYITSFCDTNLTKKGIFIGQPIRDIIFDGKPEPINKRYKINNDMKNILVLGGSSGAKTINDFFFKNAFDFNDYNVIHITGKNKLNEKLNKKNYYQEEYVNDIQNYYAWADYIIARSGSGVATELAALNKKVIFIPLTNKSSRGDQLQNALYYSKFDNMTTIVEDELTVNSILSTIKLLNYKRSKRYFYDKTIPKKIVCVILQTANINI